MNHLLKGAAATAIVLIVLMVIHVFCNMKGIELDTVVTGTMSAILAVSIYHILIKNEKNK